jgi:dTDP-4-amino-4,6-dideoxygalactose transaminase
MYSKEKVGYMKNKIKIPFNKPFIAGKELFYIAQAVIENHHTAGDGPFTKNARHGWRNTWDAVKCY